MFKDVLCTTWQKYLEFSVWLQKPVIEVFSPLVFVCLSLLQKYIYLVSFAFLCLIAFTQRQVSWIHKKKLRLSSLLSEICKCSFQMDWHLVKSWKSAFLFQFKSLMLIAQDCKNANISASYSYTFVFLKV